MILNSVQQNEIYLLDAFMFQTQPIQRIKDRRVAKMEKFTL